MYKKLLFIFLIINYAQGVIPHEPNQYVRCLLMAVNNIAAKIITGGDYTKLQNIVKACKDNGKFYIKFLVFKEIPERIDFNCACLVFIHENYPTDSLVLCLNSIYKNDIENSVKILTFFPFVIQNIDLGIVDSCTFGKDFEIVITDDQGIVHKYDTYLNKSLFVVPEEMHRADDIEAHDFLSSKAVEDKAHQQHSPGFKSSFFYYRLYKNFI